MHSSSGIEVTVRNKSEVRLYEQIFVKNVYNLHALKRMLPTQSPMIFDVGANCGFFTIRVLDIWPDASVRAFEPQGGVVSEFSRMVLLNDLSDRVKCIDCAIGKNEGEMVFYENRSPQSASLVKEKVERKRILKKYLVNVLSVDRYVGDNQISEVDILKVDVEGGELEVLEGARQTLLTVSALFIEVHSPFASANEVESIVGQYGLSRARELEMNQGHDCDLVFINRAKMVDDC